VLEQRRLVARDERSARADTPRTSAQSGNTRMI
jgi:hypothetical protein